MNVFEDYARKANSIATQHRAPLVGKIKTRREAMVRYNEIVAEIQSCEDDDTLECYLATISSEIAQFRAELDFLWKGDGWDFPGLSGEIEQQKRTIQQTQQFPETESEAERIFG